MTIDELLAAIEERREDVGRPIVIGISGYGGAGKSTLARELARRLTGAVRMRGDDFLDPTRSHVPSTDWDGVDRERLIRDVIRPFQGRRVAVFQRFDWSTRSLSAPEPVPEGEVMIVDLVGLFHPQAMPALDLTVWCDVPLDTARDRGVQRDLSLGRDHTRLWDEVWVPNDRAFDERYAPRDHADLLFDTTG